MLGPVLGDEASDLTLRDPAGFTLVVEEAFLAGASVASDAHELKLLLDGEILVRSRAIMEGVCG